MPFWSPFLTRYTFNPEEGKVNAIFLNWPVSGILELGEPRPKLGETQVKDSAHTHSSPPSRMCCVPSCLFKFLASLGMHSS